jgi:putative MATE family efflux protein
VGSRNIDATKGKISKAVWKLAYPIMVTNLVNIIYNFADTFWVSKLAYGTEAIAAVAVCFAIVFVLITFAIGLAVATNALSAQYFGAKEYEKVKDVAYTSIVLLMVISVVISSFGILFRRQLLTLLNTPENVMPYAIQYFTIIIAGMAFMFFFFLISGVLRGIGDTRTPMIIGVVSELANVVLDPFLIFGWGPFPALGISGAAYATVITKALAAFCLIYIIFSGRMHFKLKIKNIRVDFTVIKQIIKIGTPASITQIIISLGNTVLLGRVNVFGDIALAVQGLGHRLDSLIFLPAMGISQAAAIMVGQNLGAGDKKRARASGIYALKITLTILTVLGTIFFILPKVFLGIFTKEEEVLRLGVYYIRYMAFTYAFIGCRIVMNGIFQGAGAAFLSMVLSAISLWGFRIPLAYAFSFSSMGVRGIWFGVSLSFILSAGFMYYWFNKGTWTEKAVTNKKMESQDNN